MEREQTQGTTGRVPFPSDLTVSSSLPRPRSFSRHNLETRPRSFPVFFHSDALPSVIVQVGAVSISVNLASSGAFCGEPRYCLSVPCRNDIGRVHNLCKLPLALHSRFKRFSSILSPSALELRRTRYAKLLRTPPLRPKIIGGAKKWVTPNPQCNSAYKALRRGF